MATVSARAGGASSSLKVARPSWASVYAGYPKTPGGPGMEDDLPASVVFTSVFGPGYDSATYNNACATRVSLALLSGGMKKVGKRNEKITNPSHPYYGKEIEPGADNLKIFLESQWGKPEKTFRTSITLANVSAELNNKKGVYIMIPHYPRDFGATGHATLWTGTQVIGDHHYISTNTYAVYFWELK